MTTNVPPCKRRLRHIFFSDPRTGRSRDDGLIFRECIRCEARQWFRMTNGGLQLVGEDFIRGYWTFDRDGALKALSKNE